MQEARPSGEHAGWQHAQGDTTLAAYPYVRFVGSGDDMEIDDTLFFEHAGKVVFPVNRYHLNTAAPLLHELDSIVLPLANRDSMALVRMVIRGAASPEGPFLNNKRLSERRAAALANFVSERLAFHVAPERFHLDVEIEDYRALCVVMKRAGDADSQRVQALCDSYLPQGDMASLKRALMAVDNGRLWRRLLKEYFPDLRTARIFLFFQKVRPQAEKPVPVPVTDTRRPVEPAVTVELPPYPVDVPLRELLSVKTNLLLDAAYVPGYDRWCPIPNVAVEYYPLKGHFTYGASFDFPWWQHYSQHKYFQIRNLQIETRYYLKPGGAHESSSSPTGGFRGLFLQAYAHVAEFGICFDASRGWVGEGAGGGIGAGYVMPISRNGHWRLEFAAQAGFFRCKYDPYQYENPVDPTYRDHLYYYKWTSDPSLFKKRQYRWNWIGPTRIGVTLSYDLLYRSVKRKKGITLKNHETIVPERRTVL